jgi:hypothetical protein
LDANLLISAIAVAISLVASGVTIVQTRRADRLGRIPVLVFLYDGGRGRWFIRNVGYGPALNVVVAQRAESGDESWYNPVALPALGSGEQFVLEWLGDTGDYSLGARYGDLLDDGRNGGYFSYARDDRCSVYSVKHSPRWVMPDYSVGDVRRHWEGGLTWERAE